MLLVPMSYEEQVRGVIVVSARGSDRFDADDETTLSIFGASAAQALMNAANLQRLHRQQAELELQLEGQRRLLEVNERLLSTLDASGVLDLIADSLKAIVPYDSLTVYRVDRVANVRRAVIARDRFAEMILAHESELGIGITGWVIDHGEAVLANDAHLDPRSVQVPGHAVRAGVDDRRPAADLGRGDRHAEHRAHGRGGRRASPTTSSSSPSCSPARRRSRSRTPRPTARSGSGPSRTR